MNHITKFTAAFMQEVADAPHTTRRPTIRPPIAHGERARNGVASSNKKARRQWANSRAGKRKPLRIAETREGGLMVIADGQSGWKGAPMLGVVMLRPFRLVRARCASSRWDEVQFEKQHRLYPVQFQRNAAERFVNCPQPFVKGKKEIRRVFQLKRLRYLVFHLYGLLGS